MCHPDDGNRKHHGELRDSGETGKYASATRSAYTGTNYWAEHTPNRNLEVPTIITGAILARDASTGLARREAVRRVNSGLSVSTKQPKTRENSRRD
jgi:hypothetical protein